MVSLPAKGAISFFLDGDCVPEVDFIAQHKALAQAGFFVNGSRVLLSPELTQRVLAGSEQICGRSKLSIGSNNALLGHASKLSHLLRLARWGVAVGARIFLERYP